MPKYRIIADGGVFRIQRSRNVPGSAGGTDEWDNYYCYSTSIGEKRDFIQKQNAKHWYFVKVAFATYEEAAARIARLKGLLPNEKDKEEEIAFVPVDNPGNSAAKKESSSDAIMRNPHRADRQARTE